jgi:hypothetical protein
LVGECSQQRSGLSFAYSLDNLVQDRYQRTSRKRGRQTGHPTDHET